jgi:hypothetical protein
MGWTIHGGFLWGSCGGTYSGLKTAWLAYKERKKKNRLGST